MVVETLFAIEALARNQHAVQIRWRAPLTLSWVPLASYADLHEVSEDGPGVPIVYKARCRVSFGPVAQLDRAVPS